MKKTVIITVDTEGDNLWKWDGLTSILTDNVNYIPRFQDLCEEFGFLPTYLTNYEMAMNCNWIEYGKKKSKLGLCEIGMHIHAWNSPPYYQLSKKFSGNPYITEYPNEIIEKKVLEIVKILEERFECPISSCRSGRWATNDAFFSSLVKAGIKVDCSVTPGLDLSKIQGYSINCGNDYSRYKREVIEIFPGLLEVPMTTKVVRCLPRGSIKHKIKSALIGTEMWLRPIGKSVRDLVALTESVEQEKVDFIEFMIHSSELMPGGSPYFKNNDDIDESYRIMREYFSYLAKKGYKGEKLSEFAHIKKEGL